MLDYLICRTNKASVRPCKKISRTPLYRILQQHMNMYMISINQDYEFMCHSCYFPSAQIGTQWKTLDIFDQKQNVSKSGMYVYELFV